MITTTFESNQLPNNNLYSFKSNLENKTLIYIYQITCKDPNIKENYIGQTECFEKRKYAHERDSKVSDFKIYQTIRKYGGWDNWEMRIINDYYCKDIYEARQIEQKYMDIFKATMNSVRAYSKDFINEQLDRELEFELIDYSNRILGCFLYDYYLGLETDEYKMECEYCKKEFSSKSSLNNHKKTAKFCLKLQNKKDDANNFNCEYCSRNFTSKQPLLTHLNTCKNKKEDLVNIEITNLQNKLKETEKDLQEREKEFQEREKDLQERAKEFQERAKVLQHKLKEKEKEFLKFQLQEKYFLQQEENYKEQIKDLQNKLERILNKAIDRPTTTNHNTVNNKFELNTFPSQKEIDRKIESKFNDKYILDGMKGVAQFVFDHIVKLEDGSMVYACFDTSRQIFKYKDEHGNEIKDPKAVKLRKMIKPGLLRQSKTLLDYFNDECDYLEKRKDNGQDIDGKEYNIMNTLREKAFEVGCELLSIEDTNKFSNELANLSCV